MALTTDVVQHIDTLLVQMATFLLVGQILEPLPVSFQRSTQLGILLLEIGHVSLRIVLLLLDALEFALGLFNLLFDVCEEQVLIE